MALSPSVEAPLRGAESAPGAGLHRSREIVIQLSALFGPDALAGGLVIQSLTAYWFHQRFGVGLEHLGPLFSGTNLLSALSSLSAARLADRFGLLNTMVFTYAPAVKRTSRCGTIHAVVAAGCSDSIGASRIIANGCSYPTSLYHGFSRTGGEGRCGWPNKCGTSGSEQHRTGDFRNCVSDRSQRSPVCLGRWAEDCLRLDIMACVSSGAP